MPHQPRILLVEDNLDEALLAQRAFANAGLGGNLVRVTNGAEALLYLRRQGPWSGNTDPRPSVVVVDLHMPTMGGLEFLEALRADAGLAQLPVVMLTSDDADDVRREAYRRHVNSFVRKPALHEQFVLVARQLGQYWTSVNLPPP
jgi:CheY-like chemotaxis protein